MGGEGAALAGGQRAAPRRRQSWTATGRSDSVGVLGDESTTATSNYALDCFVFRGRGKAEKIITLGLRGV